MLPKATALQIKNPLSIHGKKCSIWVHFVRRCWFSVEWAICVWLTWCRSVIWDQNSRQSFCFMLWRRVCCLRESGNRNQFSAWQSLPILCWKNSKGAAEQPIQYSSTKLFGGNRGPVCYKKKAESWRSNRCKEPMHAHIPRCVVVKQRHAVTISRKVNNVY